MNHRAPAPPPPQAAQTSEWPLVRIDGRDIPRAWFDAPDEHPEVLPLLGKARAQSLHPRCLCRAQDDDPPGVGLYVCQWGDRLLLKRLPGTGHQHHPQCTSFGGITATARGLYTESAIREVGDRVVVRLGLPLTTIEQAGTSGPPLEVAADAGVAGTRRDSLSLHGLLTYIWEEARLNVHAQRAGTWRANLSAIYQRLQAAAADVDLGPRRPLSEQLYIPPPEALDPQQAQPQSAMVLARLGRLQRRARGTHGAIILVLGELLRFEPRGNFGSVLAQIKGLLDLKIWFQSDDAARLQARSAAAFARLKNRSGERDNRAADAPATRLFLLLGAVRRESAQGADRQPYLRSLYATAVETDLGGIPVASSYELAMAQYLRDQRRSFCKPMHYDADAGVFPDFELLDTKPPVPIEVWGMRTEAYLERKRAKIDLYRAQNRPCIEWDAASGQPLPPLPQP